MGTFACWHLPHRDQICLSLRCFASTGTPQAEKTVGIFLPARSALPPWATRLISAKQLGFRSRERWICIDLDEALLSQVRHIEELQAACESKEWIANRGVRQRDNCGPAPSLSVIRQRKVDVGKLQLVPLSPPAYRVICSGSQLDTDESRDIQREDGVVGSRTQKGPQKQS